VSGLSDLTDARDAAGIRKLKIDDAKNQVGA
jgi:hypothetical protein